MHVFFVRHSSKSSLSILATAGRMEKTSALETNRLSDLILQVTLFHARYKMEPECWCRPGRGGGMRLQDEFCEGLARKVEGGSYRNI